MKTALPPFSAEIEQAILGCCLLDNNCLRDLISIIGKNSNYFYDERNKIIYETLFNLSMEGKLCDLLLLKEALERKDLILRAGGIQYLIELIDKPSSASMFEHYFKELKELYIRRQLRNNARQIIEHIDNSDNHTEELIHESIKKIAELSLTKSNNVKTPHDLLNEFREYLETDEQKEYNHGYLSLNRIFGGLRQGQLVIVAARPGIGKTSLAINFMLNILDLHNVPILFFSLEMQSIEIYKRMLAVKSGIALSKINKKMLTDNEEDSLALTAASLAKKSFYIIDNDCSTPEKIYTRIEAEKERYGIKIVIIDYLQLIEMQSRNKTRYEQVSEITRRLKVIANELDVAIIALSQLNRSSDKEKREPQLYDLRESGSIEQDADVVILIYLNEDVPQSDPLQKRLWVKIAKNRNGSVGKTELIFNSPTTKFIDLADSTGTPVLL